MVDGDWLKQLKTFRGCFSVLYWLKLNCFLSVSFQFYFYYDTKQGGLILQGGPKK